MALRFMDGFDAGDFALKQWSVGSTPTVVASDRFGVGRAVDMNAGTRTLTRGIVLTGAAIVGVAIKTPAALVSWFPIQFLSDAGGVVHVAIRGNADGSLSIMRGTSQVLATSAPAVLAPVAWHYLESSCTINDTSGVVVVRVNGVEVVTFTGDTRNAGTSTQVDSVRISGQCTYDDLYISDDSGPAPGNTFLGDVRVLTSVPTGPGATTQLTPSAGANWECVDDLPYSLADYVTGATAGLKDTYQTGDVFGTSAIYGVQTNILGKKTDAGARGVAPVVRSAGTDYAATAHTLNTADTVFSAVREVDPATSAAWTQAGVNAIEIGAEVV